MTHDEEVLKAMSDALRWIATVNTTIDLKKLDQKTLIGLIYELRAKAQNAMAVRVEVSGETVKLEPTFAPMSDERRLELLAAMERWFADRSLAVELVRELLASERYWRLAVKNARLPVVGSTFGGIFQSECPFCHGLAYMHGNGEFHDQGCPRRIARESEG